MTKTALTAFLLTTLGVSQAATLYSNGPVVDGAGLSILQSGVNGTLGAASTSSATLADDFTVTGAGWTVESLEFFAYQTGSSTFTFTGVTWAVRAGSDANTATVVASGTSSVTNGGLVGYRVTTTTLTSTQRPIFSIRADVPDFNLTPGNYFVTWALAGTGVSGPFVPPVLGSLGTGNAQQSLSGGAYATLLDSVSSQPFDVPFTVVGTVNAVPEPATMALWLAGIGLVGAVARRRRH